ncbi:MAG: exodeoxyribonuclease VII large subunit, partial [Lactobacillaceae bacterium]|nr:exodeoxyribonuclease VII large subunit [Lactobacillaceae bacterium]
LLKEGLFLPEHKKPIPNISNKIAVITSPTGAVVHDIEQTVKRRFPYSQVQLFPASVQGDNAVDEMIMALDQAEQSDADVVVLARGGGSKTDLLVFNDERLVRFVFAFSKPIVTSIGHQIDRTLVDLVSDRSADTPTAAAEIVTPDFQGLKARFKNLSGRLTNAINVIVSNQNRRMENLSTEVIGTRLKLRIQNEQNNLGKLHQREDRLIENLLSTNLNKIELIQKQLQAIDPMKVLERGYAVVKVNDRISSDINDFKKDDDIEVQILNGTISAKVEKIDE